MENMKEDFDLAKWLAGEMSDSEMKSFESSTGFATYAKIKKYAAQLEAPAVDEDKLYQNVIVTKNKQPKVVPLYTKIFKAAAIIVVMLGLGYFALDFVSTTETAPNGHQTSFLLPDNSQVLLNAGSEINYKKWKWNSHRQVALEGEAYFKVAKGKSFEVATSLGKVTVLGTQFNVKSRKGRLDVACFEGRVRVNYNGTEVVIRRGQSVAFTDGHDIDVPANNGLGPEWLDNKLVFTKEKLPNIIDELARQYDTTIELQGVTSNQLFTGVLPMKNLDEALQIVASIYHLRLTKHNGKITLAAI